jgi:hypothetical protein
MVENGLLEIFQIELDTFSHDPGKGEIDFSACKTCF